MVFQIVLMIPMKKIVMKTVVLQINMFIVLVKTNVLDEKIPIGISIEI
jgi:hypothetical protein